MRHATAPPKADVVPQRPAVTPGTGLAAVDRLLPLALSQPREALAIARAVLAGPPEPGPADRSIAYQSIGIVLRDQGAFADGVEQLRRAVAAARRSGDSARVADTSASLGVALVGWGRTTSGLRRLDEALRMARGVDRARVRLRRGHVMLVLGRPEEALQELRLALRGARAAGDVLWEARCLVNRSWAYSALGSVTRADADAAAAEQLFTAIGQAREAALAVHNRGGIAYLRGDIPCALELLDDAETRYAALGSVPAELVDLRAHVLLAAGLAPEALEQAMAAVDGPDVSPVVRAELLLVAASCSLACADAGRALALANRARRLFAAQRRTAWVTQADFLRIQAGADQGRADPRTLRTLRSLAEHLERQHAVEAPVAQILLGRLARRLGRADVAHAAFRAAAARRRSGPALSRATGWLATALLAEADGRRRDVLNACARGLDALEEHRLSFGDLELRALATEHTREIARIAITAALESGRPRDILTWSERLRATALTSTPVIPMDDADLVRALAAARQATRRLTELGSERDAYNRIERERDRYESQVRRRYRQVRGTPAHAALLDVPRLVREVGDDAAVVLVDVEDTLHALVIRAGRVSRHVVGSTTTAVREAEHARFVLSRAAFGRPTATGAVGRSLQDAVLGEVADHLPERVVFVPPAGLHTVPWGLMPALTDVVACVVPCTRLWLESRSRPVPDAGRVAFVSGPGLSSDAAEIGRLRRLHANAAVLRGPAATVAATIDSMTGAAVAHVAAHGTFRADAPMFSSLRMADGPLYVHDLDRLQDPPHTLVLSACDGGGTRAVGVDEGLGMVTSLLCLGTSAVLASVVPVNDDATTAVMEAVHTSLASGDDLATAWRAARQVAHGDPDTWAAATAFVPWGAGQPPCSRRQARDGLSRSG